MESEGEFPLADTEETYGPSGAASPLPPHARPFRWALIVAFILGATLAGLALARGFDAMRNSYACAVISVFGILLIYGYYRLTRVRSIDFERVLDFMLISITVACFFHTNSDDFFEKRSDRGLHTWNVFHYVLASKYFDEVGYFDLYKAAYMADEENLHMFEKAKNMRDMYTYKNEPIDDMLSESERARVRGAFSDDRWKEFCTDLKTVLRLKNSRQYWIGPLLDRGFNPSPAWLGFHYLMLNRIDISRTKNLIAVCRIGDIFLIVSFGILIAYFGYRQGLLAIFWFNLHYGNAERMLGGYFSYDWFFAFVAAICLYQSRRWIGSAFFMAFSAVSRGFPAAALANSGIEWCISFAKNRKFDRSLTIYFVSFALTCSALGLLGGVTKHGFKAWSEWDNKISIHSKNHVLGENRLGLKYLFAYNPASDRWKVSGRQAEQRLERLVIPFRITQFVLVALTLIAMIRRRGIDGYVLFVPLVFWLIVLSRYYLSISIVFFLCSSFDKQRIWNTFLACMAFAMQFTYYFTSSLKTWPLRKIVYYTNLTFALVALFVVISYLVKDAKEIGIFDRSFSRTKTQEIPSA